MLIIFRYMFKHCCAHHQEVKIVLYSIWWYRHACRGPSGAQVEEEVESSLNLRTGQPPTECDDTRCCIIQF